MQEIKQSYSNPYYESAYKVTEDMHETSPEYCYDCRYRLGNSCNYINATGHSRRCPGGWCNKYEKQQGKRKNVGGWK